LDDQMVYPYPFAALSEQGIWWEEFLQTVKVRYWEPTSLTRYFGIPLRQYLDVPIFIYVKKGNPLSDHVRLETRQRNKFTSWVWDQLKVEYEFVNLHNHPVEIWWVADKRKELQSTLQPYHVAAVNCRLSHTFWIRDARVNQHIATNRNHLPKLSENSTMEVIKVITDDPGQQAIIHTKACFDLTTNCDEWYCDAHVDASGKNEYANNYCRKTCGTCNEYDDYKAQRAQTKCQDHRGDACRMMARSGDCQNSADYMKIMCPKACKFCTPDNNDNGNNEGMDGDYVSSSDEDAHNNSSDDSNDNQDGEEEDDEQHDVHDEF